LIEIKPNRRPAGFHPHGLELGFSQAVVREQFRLTDQPDRTCDAVDAIARASRRCGPPDRAADLAQA
jgi:hypothetical protein